LGGLLAAFCFEELTWPARLPDEPRLRRLDLAVDLGFPAQLGTAFLDAMSGLSVPGLKRTVWYDESQAQTIYFRRGTVVKFRVYDKGVQAGTAPAGTRIRIERQIRWPKKNQPRPQDLTPSDLEALWLGELKAWAAAGQTLCVGTPPVIQEELLNAIDGGRLKPLEAEKLSGYVALRAAGRGSAWWKSEGRAHIPPRREKELRELGLALIAPGETAAARVPLGGILSAVRDAWTRA
jgi:hypothetical protein